MEAHQTSGLKIVKLAMNWKLSVLAAMRKMLTTSMEPSVQTIVEMPPSTKLSPIRVSV